jgi:hypothetical protein
MFPAVSTAEAMRPAVSTAEAVPLLSTRVVVPLWRKLQVLPWQLKNVDWGSIPCAVNLINNFIGEQSRFFFIKYNREFKGEHCCLPLWSVNLCCQVTVRLHVGRPLFFYFFPLLHHALVSDILVPCGALQFCDILHTRLMDVKCGGLVHEYG